MTRALAYACATVGWLVLALVTDWSIRETGAVVPSGAKVALGYVFGYCGAACLAALVVTGRRR